MTTAQGASGRDLTPDGLKKCDCFEVGNYTKMRKLGSGAFSTVYKCHDRHIERMVSVKVLRNGKDTFDSGLSAVRGLWPRGRGPSRTMRTFACGSSAWRSFCRSCSKPMVLSCAG